MATNRILTEDEIHTLLHAPSRRHANGAPSTSSINTSPPNAIPDDVLNNIQSELRQLRSLMASRMPLGLSGGAHTSPLKYRILQRLTTQGFREQACEKLLTGLTLSSDENLAWQQVVISLETQLPIARENILDYHGIVAFVGPTGSGKTTGIAKLATQFIQRHNNRDIGLITTDYYSVSGRDQLGIYGRILDIPVHRVNNTNDLTEALTHLREKRLILIDTPGLSPRDQHFEEKLNILLQSTQPIKTLLTLPATTHEKLLDEIIATFNFTQLAGISITKIDEAPFIGHILSACIEYQLPIYSLSHGQQMPAHLMIATLEKVLNHALKEPYVHQNSFSHETMAAKNSTATEDLIC